jgi:phenylalanine-4-hydroxylase
MVIAKNAQRAADHLVTRPQTPYPQDHEDAAGCAAACSQADGQYGPEARLMQRQMKDPSNRHGAAAGEAGRPERADWTIDQDWERYTPSEHAVWKTLFERQSKLLPGRACDEFIVGMRALPIDADGIPDFRRLNEALMKRTRWEVVAVPGLVPGDVFFDHLANRRFPTGQFIRKPDQLDYLEEPDVFHDVFGHVPMLMNPVIADYIQAYGVGGLRAQKLGMLLMQRDGLRIYGSGIVSSFSETIFALEDSSPNRLRFDLERVMRTAYRYDDFQETYFAINDLDELLELARIDFGPIYERVRGQPDIPAGEVLETDKVITRGTGRYHRGRKKGA